MTLQATETAQLQFPAGTVRPVEIINDDSFPAKKLTQNQNRFPLKKRAIAIREEPLSRKKKNEKQLAIKRLGRRSFCKQTLAQEYMGITVCTLNRSCNNCYRRRCASGSGKPPPDKLCAKFEHSHRFHRGINHLQTRGLERGRTGAFVILLATPAG